MAPTLDSLKPIFPRYDYKYTDRVKEACSTYLSDEPPASEMEGAQAPRHTGGELTTKVIDWKGKSRGLFFHHPQANVNVICVKLSEECKSPVPVICRERTRTRCTQTRYRESSAQTRPYLPDIAGDKENYQNFEVYKISKLLDTCGPPGEYEANIVERARRRRHYKKSLQTVANDKTKQQTILVAMEWEDWVAREEDIQGCQMLRMEIVQQMFNERQKNLHTMSDQRIECSAERIRSKRAHQMNKINVEYARGLRRLEGRQKNVKRCYRKENIIQEHIDPASDLHAPQMRFGVNPNRRHFVGFRKTFDDRISDLDKQKEERGLAALVCPFGKLKRWAKPKQRVKEVSQRFCSDENLKNLYESLKGLRTISEAPKPNPKCLKRKVKPEQVYAGGEVKKSALKTVTETPKIVGEVQVVEITDTQELPTNEVLIENLRQRRSIEISSKTDEEISSVLGEFEGTTLGKLMVFLNDELERLKQQKKFQAIQMLAQRERWRREASEAGLRQRENKLREDQEKLYKAACDDQKDNTSLFLESVLEEEYNFTAETLSSDKIKEIAKQIDIEDIHSSCLQGRERQIYDRAVISDFVKNQVFAVAEKRFAKMKEDQLHEAELKAIEEELYAAVEKALAAEYQAPDSFCIVGEVLDELFDEVVTCDFDTLTPYSSDNLFDTEGEVNEIINKLVKLVIQKPTDADRFSFTDEIAEREAKAVIRKIISRVISEKCWKREGERIGEQTLSETFNDAIYEVECLKESRYVRNNEKLNQIISEIYNRMGDHQKNEQDSSHSTLAACLQSFRSTIDFFEKFPDPESDDNEGNLSFVDKVLTEQTMGKIDFIDRKQLKSYEPSEVSRHHERFNIAGRVAKRYQHEECGGIDLQIYSEESDVSSTTSNSGLVSYTSQYLDLATSKVFSQPWIRNIHPELSNFKSQDTSVLRTSSSYERGSAGFNRMSDCYRKLEHKDRRASF